VHSSGVILLVANFFSIFYIKFFEEKLGKKNVFSKENFATFSEFFFFLKK
jgi:hypothetical protein